MKNAHERFGKLVYVRRTEKTATNIRLHLDAFVGEERGKAHLASLMGGDVEIGAIAAAFANGDMFTVIDPSGAESIVGLGEKPLLFRGSIVLRERKRPLRHMMACSQELVDTSSGQFHGRALYDDLILNMEPRQCRSLVATPPVSALQGPISNAARPRCEIFPCDWLF